MIEQVSFSEIELWLECPKLWESSYVHHIHSQSSIETMLGHCYHRALQANFSQKVTSGKDLPIGEVLEVFVNEWNHYIKVSPPRRGRGMSRQWALKAGKVLLSEYMTTMAPSVQPVEVEQKHYSEVAGVRFVVVPDLITIQGIVIDHKTARTIAKYKNCRYRLQPSAIAYCLGRPIAFHYHVALKGVRWDKFFAPGYGTVSVDDQFKERRIYVAKTFRLRDDMDSWYKVAEEAILGMKSGVVLPRFKDCSRCGVLGCEPRAKMREEQWRAEQEAKDMRFREELAEEARKRAEARAIGEKREEERRAILNRNLEASLTPQDRIEEAKYQRCLKQQGYKV